MERRVFSECCFRLHPGPPLCCGSIRQLTASGKIGFPVRVALWARSVGIRVVLSCKAFRITAHSVRAEDGRVDTNTSHTHMFQRVLQWSIMQPAALFYISRARQFVKGLFTFVKSVMISICCSHKELLLALCVFLSLFGCLVHVCSVGRLKYRHLVATYLASP